MELDEEEELHFVPRGFVSDLAPAVLAKAFASFTVPEKSEGFDEAREMKEMHPFERLEVAFEWQTEAKSPVEGHRFY